LVEIYLVKNEIDATGMILFPGAIDPTCAILMNRDNTQREDFITEVVMLFPVELQP